MHRLFGPPRDSDPPDNLSRRPTTANPNRPRATPSERYLRRSSARIREARADMESAADLLDSLSDIPLHNPFTFHNTNARARSPIIEVAADRRQTKRRKLDHNAGLKSEYNGFKYGYKGQVVPGRLKMEILSCDGGEYFDKDHPIGLHSVRNVLKNDSSVYCSESSRCNLLLKHIGDAPFTLEKIVIRAPDRGFTAPYVAHLLWEQDANVFSVYKKDLYLYPCPRTNCCQVRQAMICNSSHLTQFPHQGRVRPVRQTRRRSH